MCVCPKITARMSGVWPPLVLSLTSAPSASNADTALSSPEVTALVNGMLELTARSLQNLLTQREGLVRYFTVSEEKDLFLLLSRVDARVEDVCVWQLFVLRDYDCE